MGTDLRLALRTLTRRPLFSVAVVLTLAVGLGANATIFSVVDSVLLRSLPYPDDERLVALWATVQRDEADPDSVERRGLSLPDLRDLAEQVESFEQVAGYDGTSFRVGRENPERVLGTRADAAYFDLLGVEPVLGSGLSDEPADAQGLPGIVLSHALWQRRFAGDPAVVGSTVEVNGEPAQVVGVAPAGFRGLVDASELWFPLAAIGQGRAEDRGARWLAAVGRLREDASLDQARQQMEALFTRLEQEHPRENQGYSAGAAPLAAELVGDLRSPLLILWAAVLAVLLIAAVNVVNLFVVHLRARSGDVAVCRALGASSFRLARRFVLEAVVLAVFGGALGLVFAVGALRVLRPMAPVDLPGLFSVGLGGRAMLFALGLTLLSGFAVGALAVLRGLGRRLGVELVAGSVQDRRETGRDPVRSGLLVAEVALATLLTIAAGLLVQSFWTMADVDPGMTTKDVGFLSLDLTAGRDEMAYPEARAQVLETVRAFPGVATAALSRDTPFGGTSATVASPEGAERDPSLPYSGAVRIYLHQVTPDFFRALDIPLLRGRSFDRGDSLPPDDESSGPQAPGVAVVTEAFAAKVWPGVDPLGQRFYLGPPVEEEAQGQERPWFDVVGVVADHSYRNLVQSPDAPQDPDVFFAMEQFNPGFANLVVRSELPTEALMLQIGRELRSRDPRLLTFNVDTLEARLVQETARPRFSGLLMTSFAVLSLLLAAVGIYGVVAHNVQQRRREIGIRMALGADRARVLTEVSVPSLATVVAGLVLGVLAALAAGRVLETQLFGVSATDPRVFAGSVLVLGVVGTLAAFAPARRASRFEPVEALRED